MQQQSTTSTPVVCPAAPVPIPGRKATPWRASPVTGASPPVHDPGQPGHGLQHPGRRQHRVHPARIFSCLSGELYQVKAGDTFQKIAEAYGISTLELAERNPGVKERRAANRPGHLRAQDRNLQRRQPAKWFHLHLELPRGLRGAHRPGRSKLRRSAHREQRLLPAMRTTNPQLFPAGSLPVCATARRPPAPGSCAAQAPKPIPCSRTKPWPW